MAQSEMKKSILLTYGRLVRIPILGFFVRLPVRFAKTLLGVPPAADLRTQLLMTAMDSLRGDVDRLSARFDATNADGGPAGDVARARFHSDLLSSATDALRGDVDELVIQVEELRAQQNRIRGTLDVLCAELECDVAGPSGPDPFVSARSLNGMPKELESVAEAGLSHTAPRGDG